MLIPFDEWCTFTVMDRTPTLNSTRGGILCDVALAFCGAKCRRPVDVDLQSLSAISGAPSAKSLNIVFHLHRLLLVRELPSYFGPLICSPSSGLYLREDRLSAQVTTVGVPMVLRYLYTGEVGVGRLICNLEKALEAPTADTHDDGGPADRPLGVVDLLHALIVSLAWATAVPAASGRDPPAPKWTSTGADSDATTKLHSMALTLFDSLCSITELVQLDEKSELCEPPSQLPASQMPSQRPRAQIPPVDASPERQFLELVLLLTALDDAISSQVAHNDALQSSSISASTLSLLDDKRKSEAVDGSAALLSCATSHFFAPLSLEPTSRALASASSATAASQLYEDIENYLVSPPDSTPGCETERAVTAGDVLGFLWVRVREALVALGAQCIGTRTLLSFLSEMAPNDSLASISPPTLEALEVVRTHAGKNHHGIAGANAFVLEQASVGSWLEEHCGFHVNHVPTVLMEQVPCRILGFLLFRWIELLQRALAEAGAALLSLDSSTSGASHPDEDARCFSHAATPPIVLLSELTKQGQWWSHIVAQAVALARLACCVVAAAFPRLDAVGGDPSPFVAGKDALAGAFDASFLPARYGVPEMSLWDCFSLVVMSAPLTLHTVRCDKTPGMPGERGEGTSGCPVSLVLGSCVDADTLLTVWCAALRNRDVDLVERILQSVRRSGMSGGKRRRDVDEHPIWRTLHQASLDLVPNREGRSLGRRDECGRSAAAAFLPAANFLAAHLGDGSTTIRKAERCESVPLFPSTFVAAVPALTAASAAMPGRSIVSNAVPLFSNDSRTPASAQSDAAAQDEELLQQVIDAVRSALDRAPVQQRDESLREDGAPTQQGVEKSSASTTVSSAPSSQGGVHCVVPQPRLLSLEAPSRDCLDNREKLGRLASQLHQAQQARKEHLHKFTTALLDEVRTECERLRSDFKASVEAASKPLLDEVNAMRRTRDELVQKSRETEVALTSAGRTLEALQLRCVALRDDAQHQTSSCRRALATLDLGIAAAMDALQSDVLPRLQQQRAHGLEVLAKKLTVVVEELQCARLL